MEDLNEREKGDCVGSLIQNAFVIPFETLFRLLKTPLETDYNNNEFSGIEISDKIQQIHFK